MKFGIRTPSFKKRISARTSPKRIIRHNLGVKAPKGFGIFTNPKKATYNKVYNKTSFGITGKSKRRKKGSDENLGCGCLIIIIIIIIIGALK